MPNAPELGPYEKEARAYLGNRYGTVTESQYLKSVLKLVQARENLDRALGITNNNERRTT